MNKIFKPVLFGAALLTLSCQNWYNDHNFEGYKEGGIATDIKNIEYTLTDADYATVASNSTNKKIAEDAGMGALLSAIKSTKCFTDYITPDLYMPAFISSTWPTADNGSVANITYNMAVGASEKVVRFSDALQRTLSKEDYQIIWDSAEDYIESLTPNTESKLSKVLPTDGVENGKYLVATYNYATSEPSFSTTPDPGPTFEYSSLLGTAAKGETVTVTACVTALSAQGPIISDNTGSILLYKGTGYALGDVLKVEGKLSSYNYGMQFDATAATIDKVGTDTVKYEMPFEVDGAMLDQILTRNTDQYARLAKFTAKVAVSGNYYNFNVEGATTAQGSFYGLTDELKAQLSDGADVTFYGFISSVSKSGGAPKFVNVVLTSLNAEPQFNNGLTSVLGQMNKNDNITATACVVALSAQGPIIADNSGAALLYKGSGLALGDVIALTAVASSYNFGKQIDASKETTSFDKVGQMTFAYPYAQVIDGAKLDQCLTVAADFNAKYVETVATVAVSGNYYNFNVEGSTSAQGSFYGITDELKAQVTDGQTYKLRGYFSSVSKSGGVAKFVNVVVTEVIPANAPQAATPQAAVVVPKSSVKYAVLEYNGSKFVDAGFAVLQPSDYTEMGQKYGNLTEPEKYLPKYMNYKYPYAEAGDVKNLAYIFYDGSQAKWMLAELTFDGQAWKLNDGKKVKTDQFRLNDGVWKIDHTLELDYTEMGAAEVKAFCQYCCNWVYDFVDVANYSAPARDNAGVIITADGVKVNGANPAQSTFVSSYGNNEWYAGTYAYYGEINWDGAKAQESWTKAGFTLTNDEIVEKMKDNCKTVFAEVLHYMYPEATSETYSKVIIKVYDYVSKANYAYSFEIVEKGKFQYIEDSFVQL